MLLKVSGWIFALLALEAICVSQQSAMMESVKTKQNVVLTMDPTSQFWRAASPVFLEVDANGHTLPEYRTEVRSRWSEDSIYFLFVCPYKHLYLKPDPDVVHETFRLWNWNVTEVFIGSDFNDIKRYREFEISPLGEWIDLDVDLHNPHHEEGWVWNSGFEHSARIDETRHVWYAAMRIPIKAISASPVVAGTKFRLNLYRTEGSPQEQKEIMWRPVFSDTFHVPDRFGLLTLETR